MALLPLVESAEYVTSSVRFANDTEQRWTDRGKLRRFRLTIAGVPGVDISRVRTFWASVVGPRDQWDITINGVTYSNLVFEGDEFRTTIAGGDGRESVELAVRQVRG